MSRIRDEEDLLVSIRDHVKARLNARIVAINSEKTDFQIDQITADDSHYVLGGELLDIPNHAFVNFAIEGDIETISNGNDTAFVVNILAEVAFDNPKTANTYLKSLRYSRALKECLQEYGSVTSEVADIRMTRARPMVVAMIKRELVVSGVSVSVAIG